ncbi:MAG: ATP-binding cassette domain-containing protein [Defluviitaleaceae bacterium]|nr:ATP-binding cassette domain-containing protein [Defluviitaleaceae bacterium]MCL2239057.1 ATP-binding cassette domain-containing protein [Defluviitaleaceae bacterium]
MILLKDVNKTFTTRYGNVDAVRDASMEVSRGEIFGVIGHSGAGKSTLIRCINLLEVPTTGSVMVDGVNLTELPKKELSNMRRKIGMIFQHFYLMPSRTVKQNVLLPLKNAKMPKAQKQRKAEELLHLVGLSHRINAYPSALSGGEKQRVAIARALANDPIVLLCDEATSALDPQTTKSILNLLREVNKKLNLTIVLITHEMAVIKEICHRVAVMDGGKIRETGDVFSIFAAPQSDTAKEFVASTNNLHKVDELIASDSPLVKLAPDEKLVKLTFTAGNAQDSLLHQASVKFGVHTNIFFGNVDIIQNRTLGNLVVIIKGEGEGRDKALRFLEENNVRIEVMK